MRNIYILIFFALPFCVSAQSKEHIGASNNSHQESIVQLLNELIDTTEIRFQVKFVEFDSEELAKVKISKKRWVKQIGRNYTKAKSTKSKASTSLIHFYIVFILLSIILTVKFRHFKKGKTNVSEEVSVFNEYVGNLTMGIYVLFLIACIGIIFITSCTDRSNNRHVAHSNYQGTWYGNSKHSENYGLGRYTFGDSGMYKGDKYRNGGIYEGEWGTIQAKKAYSFPDYLLGRYTRKDSTQLIGLFSYEPLIWPKDHLVQYGIEAHKNWIFWGGKEKDYADYGSGIICIPTTRTFLFAHFWDGEIAYPNSEWDGNTENIKCFKISDNIFCLDYNNPSKLISRAIENIEVAEEARKKLDYIMKGFEGNYIPNKEVAQIDITDVIRNAFKP